MKGGCFTRKHREILGERGSRERDSGGLGVIAVVIRETDARLHGNFRTSGRRWAGLAPSRGARGSGRARGSPRRPGVSAPPAVLPPPSPCSADCLSPGSDPPHSEPCRGQVPGPAAPPGTAGRSAARRQRRESRGSPGACAPPRSAEGAGGRARRRSGPASGEPPARTCAAGAAAALRAGAVPAPRRCPRPRTSAAGRGNRPERERERERTCSSVPACLPAARASSPAAHPPTLRVLLPPYSGPVRWLRLERFPAGFPRRCLVGSGTPRRGSVPQASCLTLRGKGAGWGQARKGGSQWLS